MRKDVHFLFPCSFSFKFLWAEGVMLDFVHELFAWACISSAKEAKRTEKGDIKSLGRDIWTNLDNEGYT